IDEKLSTLGSHIGNAYNKFAEVSSSYNRIGQKLNSSQELIPDDETKKLK
ncbi:MAG: hypothetical protein UV54_C0008G0010, partial [Candidatus Beckwithbacteria bacterium GW2011_GWA2_43_10]